MTVWREVCCSSCCYVNDTTVSGATDRAEVTALCLNQWSGTRDINDTPIASRAGRAAAQESALGQVETNCLLRVEDLNSPVCEVAGIIWRGLNVDLRLFCGALQCHHLGLRQEPIQGKKSASDHHDLMELQTERKRFSYNFFPAPAPWIW